MNNKRNVLKISIISICSLLILLIVGVYGYIFFSGKKFMDEYKYKAYPSSYLNGVDISGMSDKELSTYLVKLENNIKNIKINVNVNDKSYNYKLDDLGVSINKREVMKNIISKKEKTSIMSSVKRLFNSKKESYQYTITYSEIGIRDFVNNLKKQVDIEGLSGEIIEENHEVSYQGYKEGYSLDKDSTKKIVETEIYRALKNQKAEDIKVINVKATGEKIDKSDHDLSSIDTKISSFKVKYGKDEKLQNNLKIAIGDIDKVVIMPGNDFSFFDYAGPYDKTGYQAYENMVGNGVCQVSTALYNSLLNAGIKPTKRETHAELVDYVPGGLDAMVASSGNTNLTDFTFKNTLNYPLYISAYFEGEYIVIDLWSNKDALEGFDYKVESVALNKLAYKTYLYKYSNGEFVDQELISTDIYKK